MFFNNLSRLVIPIAIVVTTLAVNIIYNLTHYDTLRRNAQRLVGSYRLDLEKTNLGNYREDSLQFVDVMLTFNEDLTFQINKQLPFMLDSVGRWHAGSDGLEDWNYLFYEKWGYDHYKKEKGDRFTHGNRRDSTFYVNSATPKQGMPVIAKVYFKKQDPKPGDLY